MQNPDNEDEALKIATDGRTFALNPDEIPGPPPTPAYRLWHCGMCDLELEEGKFDLVCTADGSRYTYSGERILDGDEDGGPR